MTSPWKPHQRPSSASRHDTFAATASPHMEVVQIAVAERCNFKALGMRSRSFVDPVEVIENIVKSQTPSTPGQRRYWLSRERRVAPDVDGKTPPGGLVLVASEHRARLLRGGIIGWEHVDALCITQRTASESEQSVRARLLELIRAIFLAQPTRSVVLANAITGNSMTSYYADQHGVVDMGRLSIDANPEDFLEIVEGMASLEDEDLGRGGAGPGQKVTPETLRFR